MRPWHTAQAGGHLGAGCLLRRAIEVMARCVGTPAFNGFYGAGIVNALGVVR